MKTLLLMLSICSVARAQYNELNQDSMAHIVARQQARGMYYVPRRNQGNANGKIVISEILWKDNKTTTMSIWNQTDHPISNITVSYDIRINGRAVDSGEFTFLPQCRYCLTRIAPGTAMRFYNEGITKKNNETIVFKIIDYDLDHY